MYECIYIYIHKYKTYTNNKLKAICTTKIDATVLFFSIPVSRITKAFEFANGFFFHSTIVTLIGDGGLGGLRCFRNPQLHHLLDAKKTWEIMGFQLPTSTGEHLKKVWFSCYKFLVGWTIFRGYLSFRDLQ